MRIGFAKLGRAIKFEESKFGYQGDCEAPNHLKRLALMHPQHEFVVVGKSTGWDGRGEDFPKNVMNAWTGLSARAMWKYVDGALRCAGCDRPGGSALGCCDRGTEFLEDEAYIENVIAGLDGAVIHLGQHGTSQNPIPITGVSRKGGVLTSPYVWARNYAGFLVRGLNRLDDRTGGGRIVYLCADPRNYHKARDLKGDPGEILSGYRYTREQTHFQWDHKVGIDAEGRETLEHAGTLIKRRHRYVDADIEMLALPGRAVWSEWGKKGWSDRKDFGIATTSYSGEGKTRRSLHVKRLWEAGVKGEVHGKWDDESKADCAELGLEVVQSSLEEFPEVLGSWKSTVALPVWGSGWSTGKTVQAWATRTVCFQYGGVDKQGLLVPLSKSEGPDGLAARYLRVADAADLKAKVEAVAGDEALWRFLVRWQERWLQQKWDEHRVVRVVGQRLGL